MIGCWEEQSQTYTHISTCTWSRSRKRHFAALSQSLLLSLAKISRCWRDPCAAIKQMNYAKGLHRGKIWGRVKGVEDVEVHSVCVGECACLRNCLLNYLTIYICILNVYIQHSTQRPSWKWLEQLLSMWNRHTSSNTYTWMGEEKENPQDIVKHFLYWDNQWCYVKKKKNSMQV